MERVVIIGAGLAGLSCARTLAEDGVASVLVSLQHSERAASVLAEGGINAAMDVMGEHDSWEQHFEDTMRAGHLLADARSVAGLCYSAPAVVRSLIGLGVPFQTEGGALVQRSFGGQKKKRTAFVGSVTGKMLVGALVDAVRRYEAAGLVERRPHAELAKLELAGGRCVGAWVQDSYSGERAFLAGPVVLAAGSMGGIFGPRTTGSKMNAGNVAAVAFSQGVELANLEFIQYHPTTIPIFGKRLLVSEAARGEGGRLFTMRDGKPWYFMEELYPELGNLMPRDVVSREEHAQMADPRNDGTIYLDMRGIAEQVWRERLSDLRDEITHYTGRDPAVEPVAVEPGIHYCMGGVLVDEAHATNIAGLYAAGECACAYHGANRLGGNSTLGAIYGGGVAARSAAGYLASEFAAREPEPFDESYALAGAVDLAAELALEDCAFESLGLVRCEDELAAGEARAEELLARSTYPQLARRARLVLAAIRCARERTESRGAHVRSDYPEADPALQKSSVVRTDGARIAHEFRAPASSLEDIDTTSWGA